MTVMPEDPHQHSARPMAPSRKRARVDGEDEDEEAELTADAPSKKQSKWTEEENRKIVKLRGGGEKWERISEQLPGRSAISCRLHYQNFLEKRPEWDEEKLNRLARLYERFKKNMWSEIARELEMPWRAVEYKHWELGSQGVAKRTGTTEFMTHTTSSEVPPPAFATQPRVETAYPQGYSMQPYAAPYPVTAPAQMPYPPPGLMPYQYPPPQPYHGTVIFAPPVPASSLSVPRTRRSSTSGSQRARKTSRASQQAEPPQTGSRPQPGNAGQPLARTVSRELPSPYARTEATPRQDTPYPDTRPLREGTAPAYFPHFTPANAPRPPAQYRLSSPPASPRSNGHYRLPQIVEPQERPQDSPHGHHTPPPTVVGRSLSPRPKSSDDGSAGEEAETGIRPTVETEGEPREH